MTKAARQAEENGLAAVLAAAIMRSRATHSTTVEHGGFEVREHRHESGLIEIAVYTPEVVPGDGEVLRAVVTRMPGKRNWIVQVCAQRVWAGRSKRRALEFAVGKAITMSRKAREGTAYSAYPHSQAGKNAPKTISCLLSARSKK